MRLPPVRSAGASRPPAGRDRPSARRRIAAQPLHQGAEFLQLGEGLLHLLIVVMPRHVDEEVVSHGRFLLGRDSILDRLMPRSASGMSIRSSEPECAAAASPSEMAKLVMSLPLPTGPDAFLPRTKNRVVLSALSWMFFTTIGTPWVVAASSLATAAAPGSSLAICTAREVLGASMSCACGRG